MAAYRLTLDYLDDVFEGVYRPGVQRSFGEERLSNRTTVAFDSRISEWRFKWINLLTEVSYTLSGS
jgi:hypothetical protein